MMDRDFRKGGNEDGCAVKLKLEGREDGLMGGQSMSQLLRPPHLWVSECLETGRGVIVRGYDWVPSSRALVTNRRRQGEEKSESTQSSTSLTTTATISLLSLSSPHRLCPPLLGRCSGGPLAGNLLFLILSLFGVTGLAG